MGISDGFLRSRNRIALAIPALLASWHFASSAAAPAVGDTAKPTGFISQFAAPPDDCRAWVFYFVGDGNHPLVTREGITRDLEAMKEQGLGGIVLFYGWAFRDSAGKMLWQNQEPWWDLMRHVLREARRLSLRVLLFNSPVWNSGGPWIKPAQAMKEATWSRLDLEGPRRFSGALPPLPAREGFTRDAALIAYPRPADGKAGRMRAARPVARTSTNLAGRRIGSPEVHERQPSDLYAPGDPLQSLSDGNTLTRLTLSAKEDPRFIDYEFAQPFACDSLFLRLDATHSPEPVECTLQVAREAGQDFQLHHRFARKPAATSPAPQPEAGREPFPPVIARRFRLEFRSKRPAPVSVAEFELLARNERALGESAVWHLAAKSGSRPPLLPGLIAETVTAELPSFPCVPPEQVADLTALRQADGTLEWNVPPGRWTLLRFGYTVTGIRCGAPWTEAALGVGLEVDRMSRPALETHFRGHVQRFLDDPALKDCVQAVEEDSWEAWLQNWTETMPGEFWTRRGYAITPWLPVLAGEVVQSLAASERFLWDFRRTQADLVADHFYGAYLDLCHQHGVEFHGEAPGPNAFRCPPSDPLMFKGRTDVPMGEFHSFFTGHFEQPDGKEAASAAHLYGRPVAAAEAFTGVDDFRKDPFALKALGDRAYCAGINQFYLHVYTHKPDERKPGSIMATLWGVGFHRHQTWWPMARAYFDYLARCQYLLRAGQYRGDLLYFYGEGAPGFAWGEESARNHGSLLRPAVPRGYGYDWCNAEALLKRLSVRDGKLVTPDGVTYYLLILPEPLAVTPPVLRRIAQLIEDGATVIGPRPSASPSLVDSAASDAEIHRLADALWGTGSSSAQKSAPEVRSSGKGRVISGLPMERMPLREILDADRIPPDFDFRGGTGNPELLHIHRAVEGREFYFVSNQSDQAQEGEALFRVTAGCPVLLDPVTGQARDLPEFQQTTDGRISVPMRFAPRQALFVAFEPREREPGTATGLASNFPIPQTIQTLAGEWEVSFDPAWGGPANTVFASLQSWTKHASPGIRHYSGIAVYRKRFDAPDAPRLSATGCFLDLGRVKNLARVKLNGRSLGTVWTAPWRVAIPAGLLRNAGNELEVEVANLWINRLQLDRALPEAERLTWTNAGPGALGGKDLPPAGLLGPVSIVSESAHPAPAAISP